MSFRKGLHLNRDQEETSIPAVTLQWRNIHSQTHLLIYWHLQPCKQKTIVQRMPELSMGNYWAGWDFIWARRVGLNALPQISVKSHTTECYILGFIGVQSTHSLTSHFFGKFYRQHWKTKKNKLSQQACLINFKQSGLVSVHFLSFKEENQGC